jgi:hypothetical protein
LKGTKEFLPNEDYDIVYTYSDQFIEKLSNLITDKNYLKN